LTAVLRASTLLAVKSDQTVPWFTKYHDLFDVLSSAATIIGIIVAGIWTYQLFIRQRTLESRAEVRHEITQRALTPTQALVHVTVFVENKGNVELRPGGAYTLLQQVLPIDSAMGERLQTGRDLFLEDSTEIRWPELRRIRWEPEKAGVTIEPGETERWDADFLVPTRVVTVGVFSEFSLDKTDTSVAWSAQDFYDLVAAPPTRAPARGRLRQ
jgi:hypothetical protein